GSPWRRGERRAAENRALAWPAQGKEDPIAAFTLALVQALERHRIAQEEGRRLAASVWRGDGKYVFASSVGTLWNNAAWTGSSNASATRLACAGFGFMTCATALPRC